MSDCRVCRDAAGFCRHCCPQTMETERDRAVLFIRAKAEAQRASWPDGAAMLDEVADAIEQEKHLE